MCSPARCSQCGKTTWRGCGRHMDAVNRDVPAEQQVPLRGARSKVATRPHPGALNDLC